MVYKPHVEVLTEKLLACLDQVQAREGWLSEGVDPSISLRKDAK